MNTINRNYYAIAISMRTMVLIDGRRSGLCIEGVYKNTHRDDWTFENYTIWKISNLNTYDMGL